jgi:hypothetical protein
VSTVNSFLSVDTTSMDNIDIAKPTVDNTVVESIQNVSVHDAEIPVQLEVEWTDKAGNAAV